MQAGQEVRLYGRLYVCPAGDTGTSTVSEYMPLGPMLPRTFRRRSLLCGAGDDVDLLLRLLPLEARDGAQRGHIVGSTRKVRVC